MENIAEWCAPKKRKLKLNQTLWLFVGKNWMGISELGFPILVFSVIFSNSASAKTQGR